jgi:hypothetical protein
MKYKVGDLLTTGFYYYLVMDIDIDKYILKETTSQGSSSLSWKVKDADKDRHLKKVN